MYREGCARDDYDAVLERMHSQAGARGPCASLSWPQQVGILICCLANTVDAVEVKSLSYVLPRLKGKYPAWMQGSLSAAVVGGMLVGGLIGGGLIGGAVCDRVGRRATMIVSMLLNASFSLAFAAASGRRAGPHRHRHWGRCAGACPSPCVRELWNRQKSRRLRAHRRLKIHIYTYTINIHSGVLLFY